MGALDPLGGKLIAALPGRTGGREGARIASKGFHRRRQTRVREALASRSGPARFAHVLSGPADLDASPDTLVTPIPNDDLHRYFWLEL
jgi:hypothetical protein